MVKDNNYFITYMSPCCNAKIMLEGRYGGREVRAYCSKCRGWLKDLVIPEEIIREYINQKSI